MPEQTKATLSPSDTANTVEGKMLTFERLYEIGALRCLVLPRDEIFERLRHAVPDLLSHITALQSLVTRLEGERDRLETCLAKVYAHSGATHYVTIALLCDEYLDPSGALLGRVRSLTQGQGK